jgi:hypothetical protein
MNLSKIYKFTLTPLKVLSVNISRNSFIKSTPDRHVMHGQGDQGERGHRGLGPQGQRAARQDGAHPGAYPTKSYKYLLTGVDVIKTR